MAKYDLNFSTSFMNAAGSLGFTPPADHPDLARLGAFVTNPLSIKPRSPTRHPALIDFPGGVLLHTGYPNPGFNTVLKRYAEGWARLAIPVIVHILGERPGDLPNMLTRLENIPGVTGIELSLPAQVEPGGFGSYLQAAAGELPIILHLPLEQAVSQLESMAALFAEYHLAAFSLGPARGLLPAGTQRLVHGRLYGPGFFPQSLRAVQAYVASGLPIIGGGGVYSIDQADTMIVEGALAVQLDTVLWRGALR